MKKLSMWAWSGFQVMFGCGGARKCIKSSKGFTLLEVLIAFLMLSTCMVALLRVLSGGVRMEMVANEYSMALLFAQSILSSVSPENHDGNGTIADIDGKFRVQSGTELFGDLVSEDTAMSPIKIWVETGWGKGGQERVIRLVTLRLAPRLGTNP